VPFLNDCADVGAMRTVLEGNRACMVLVETDMFVQVYVYLENGCVKLRKDDQEQTVELFVKV
jgi:hypothetical protein